MTAYTIGVFQEGKKTVNQIWPLAGDAPEKPVRVLTEAEQQRILNIYNTIPLPSKDN